ncbi:MAG: thioredoxin [Phycisphaerales bacterium]|jgi:thioredoxin 1
MASPAVHEFTDANFDAEVLRSTAPVLVDFWAPWCGPCVKLGPTVEAVAQQYQGRVKVGKLNIDENSQHAMSLGIQSIPTIMVFKGGKMQKKHVGLIGKPDLEKILDAAIGA